MNVKNAQSMWAVLPDSELIQCDTTAFLHGTLAVGFAVGFDYPAISSVSFGGTHTLQCC